MCVVGSNIVIIIKTVCTGHKDCMYRTCDQCCVFCMRVVRSNRVIGLYILDMWSVLCVPYVGGGI